VDQQGLSLEAIWHDDDAIELRVELAHDGFSGHSRIYTSEIALHEVADSLQHFNPVTDAEVTCTLGVPESWCYLKLRVYAYNRSMHLAAQVELAAGEVTFGQHHMPRMIALEMGTQLSLLDRFAADLRGIARISSGRAMLLAD
jgi:hypothetical protein